MTSDSYDLIKYMNDKQLKNESLKFDLNGIYKEKWEKEDKSFKESYKEEVK